MHAPQRLTALTLFTVSAATAAAVSPVWAQEAAAPASPAPVPSATNSALTTPTADQKKVATGGVASGGALATAPLSLEESIRIALHQHGDPRAAAQSFEAARQAVASARAEYFPEVAANIGYDFRNGSTGNGSNTTTVSNSGTRIITTSTTTTGLTVAQNIFDGGRTRQRVNQANARALGAAGSYGNSRNSLAFNVAASYYNQLRQSKLVTQREGQVTLASQQLEAINAQIEAGTVARVDAQTVQVTLSQARFDLATARNDLSTAQVNFRNTLGLNLGPALPLVESPLAEEAGLPEQSALATPPTPAGETAVLPAPVTSPADELLSAPLPDVPKLNPIENYLAEAQRLRPDLLQARATLQSGEAAIKLAQIEQKPQVTATANYDIDPRNTGSRGLNFGAGLAIPIFNGGGRRADVKAAQADQEANKARLGQLEKDVAADVQSSYVSISGEVQRIANARVLVQQARVNLSNSTEKYRLGLGTVLDITNAQTQLFNAQTSLTSAVYDYELARADLDRSVGRFAWADPGQAPVATAPSNLPTAVATVKATTPTANPTTR